MATLDDLLKLKGIKAAGEFTIEGEVVDYRTVLDMSPETSAMTAEFSATVTMLFDTLAGVFTKLNKMNWLPQKGWMYSGGDWTVFIGDKLWVFVKTAEADFNQLYNTLIGSK